MKNELSLQNEIHKDIYSVRLHFLRVIYTLPDEAYRIYLSTPGFLRRHLYWIVFYFIGLSVVAKFISYYSLSLFYKLEHDIFIKNLTVSVIVYFSVFLLTKVLDSLLILYQWRIKQVEQGNDRFFTSFVPFFSSSIFLIVPDPYYWFFLFISFLYSVYSSVITLHKFSSFSLKDYLRFFLLFLVFTLFIILLFIIGLKVSRSFFVLTPK
jgi:hypothetical protein